MKRREFLQSAIGTAVAALTPGALWASLASPTESATTDPYFIKKVYNFCQKFTEDHKFSFRALINFPTPWQEDNRMVKIYCLIGSRFVELFGKEFPGMEKYFKPIVTCYSDTEFERIWYIEYNFKWEDKSARFLIKMPPELKLCLTLWPPWANDMAIEMELKEKV